MSDVHSCHKCKSILIDSERTGIYQKQYVLLLSDFLSYADGPDACPFFTMLASNCSWPDGYLDTMKPTSNVAIQFDSQIDSSTCLSVGKTRAKMTATTGTWSRSKYGEFLAFKCQIVADADGLAAVDVPGRILSPNFETATIAMLRTWYSSCRRNHPECDHVHYTPRRLLYVGGPGDDRLSLRQFDARFQGGIDAYVALSYIWGGVQQFRTTRANLSSRLASIHIDDLPRTLKDAVLVCRALDFQWLWVDMLCIVQDDPSDKVEQINMMGTIFQSAAVTIVAATARSSNAGFLSSTFTNAIAPLVCLRYKTLNGPESSVYLIQKPKSQPDFPIEFRGWTMQERLLSQRLLFFHEGRIDWVCRSSHLFAGCTSSYSVNIVDGRITQSYFDASRESDDVDSVSQLYRWYHLCSGFSQRQLTDSRDRLPATSGIAKEFKKHYPEVGGYVAGLWTSHLAEQLLWRKNSELDLTLEPEFYIAPSWSWAATEGQFLFPTYATEGAEVQLRILEVKCRAVDGGDLYGQLVGAHLKVRGRVKTARWDISNQTIEADDGQLVFGNTKTVPDTLEFAPQGPRAGTWTQVCCLEVQDASHWVEYLQSSSGTICTGLLLSLCPQRSMTFTRVGVFTLASLAEDEKDHSVIKARVNNLAWFEDADFRDLILV